MFTFFDTTTQKEQTFSSSGEKPVTVERAILFSQSLKVAFQGNTQKEWQMDNQSA